MERLAPPAESLYPKTGDGRRLVAHERCLLLYRKALSEVDSTFMGRQTVVLIRQNLGHHACAAHQDDCLDDSLDHVGFFLFRLVRFIVWPVIGIASSSFPSSDNVFRASWWATECDSPTVVYANTGSFMSVISGRMVSLSIMGGEGASALRSPVFLRFVWYRYSGLVAKIMVFCLKQKHYHEKYIPRRYFFMILVASTMISMVVWGRK